MTALNKQWLLLRIPNVSCFLHYEFLMPFLDLCWALTFRHYYVISSVIIRKSAEKLSYVICIILLFLSFCHFKALLWTGGVRSIFLYNSELHGLSTNCSTNFTVELYIVNINPVWSPTLCCCQLYKGFRFSLLNWYMPNRTNLCIFIEKCP